MLIRNLVKVLLSAVTLVEGQTYPVNGIYVDPKSGSVPLRRNINELQAAGGAQWDLYVRALRAMYDANPDDPLSFFQIAGVHGKPYVEWNGAGARTADGWQGYCPHGEKLFLPWHRPFLLLVEQVLVQHAKRLALEYPQRFRFEYTKAAETLRLAYWDWAASPTVPPVTVPPTLKVRVPNGNVLREVDVQNPFATFKFPQAALDGKYGSFDSQRRTQTSRCPSPDTYPAGANTRLAKRPYKSWLYDAFTHSENFAEFASTGDRGASLEQIHNGIHWDGACGSHFLQADFSAFDPLFMLHHCNIDRLWAYWQAMRPDEAIFNDTYSGGSRFSTPRGTRISKWSPLKPFFASAGQFHTANSMVDIRRLGYTYQELEYWRKSPAQMTQDARRLINRMYSPNGRTSSRLMRRSKRTTRYFVGLELEVSQIERPCSINVHVDGKRVGSLVVMQQPEIGIFHGGFSIDEATGPKTSKGLGPDAVVDSVQKGLTIEIVKLDGTQIPLKSVPSLKIQLEDVPMTPPTRDDEFPTYGKRRRRPARPVEKGPMLES